MATRLAHSIAVPTRRIERQELKRWAVAFAGISLLALLSLLYLSQASAVATAGYDIKRLESEKKQWQAKNEQLRFQVSQLRSLDRIEREASARLGMAKPQQVAFVSESAAPRSVAISSRAGERVQPATAAAGETRRSPYERPWWDGLTQWLPFSQRPLSDVR
ncbi:MAG: septum formation initiator family protein [Chloroflexota bacterium]